MKKRILALVFTICLILSMMVLPAFATSKEEQEYQNLNNIAELIKDFGLKSSDEDDPLKNMILKMLEDDPDAFYKLANEMLGSYDSHSMYIKADEYQKAFPQNLGGYVGIGVTISTESGARKITYVTPQSPADQAGIKAGDVVKAIDGQSLTGLTTEEITGRIRGSEGSPVTLMINRNGKNLSFTMKRKQINRPNFENYSVEPGIEYMRLAMFNGTDTLNRFNQAYSELAKKGTKVLILDLRGNPGGLVSMAEEIINDFVPDKDVKLFAAINRRAKNGLYVYSSSGTGIKLNNIYILVDKNSASASEITAGSLRDLGYAKLIGTNTYGKSTGQIHLGLTNGDTVVITTQQHILPKGKAFEGVGLTPDYVVKNYEENYPIPKDFAKLLSDRGIYLTHCSDRTLAIEQRLKLLGYFNETPDKNFNQATLTAVNAFRKANKLSVDSYCSVYTIKLLGQKITELSKTKVTVDAQFEKALELARQDAKGELHYTVDKDGKFTNK
ncbi:MAG: S41 family peptidase [Clostridiales bacterium]|nr:S41 family peptidase [Clostridiales bacterium]